MNDAVRFIYIITNKAETSAQHFIQRKHFFLKMTDNPKYAYNYLKFCDS